MLFDAMLTGAIAMASLVISLFFLRFWKSTRDRFFLYFAMSFALEAINRILLGMTLPQGEDAPAYYLIRMVAYALILLAIIEKNRKSGKR